jgi:hypothetical protein
VKPNYLKFFLYLAIVFIIAGCSGSPSNKGISVGITGAPTTIAPNATATLTAVVTNDSANAGVTWTVTGGGTFTSTTTQLVYTAPATVPSPATVTVTATSITDTTKSAMVTFTIATPTVSVTITNPIGTIAPGATPVTVSATVTNDGTVTPGVSWTLVSTGTTTSCQPGCGTLSAATTTSVLYTPPATVPSPATATLIATSNTDTTKTATDNITIAAAVISVTITNPIGTIAPGATPVTVNATVANDGTVTPGVAWTLVSTGTTTSCQPACGTLSAATTTSVLYTPPATVPSPATATLIATSNTDTTKTAADNITIAAATTATCSSPGTLGNEAALTAPYAFLLKGTDGDGGPLDYIGSFTPKTDGSGGISAADLDINGFDSLSNTTTVDLANSSYSYGSDGRGCLFLAFNVTAATVKPVKTSEFHVGAAKHSRTFKAQNKPRRAVLSEDSIIFAFAMLGTETGRIQEFDNTNGSGNFVAGQMHLQTPGGFSLTLSPNFAFGLDGWVVNGPNSIGRSAIAGSFANSEGQVSNVTADENFAGTVSGEQTGGMGTLSTPSSTTGRGTGTFTISTPDGNLVFDFVYYVVNDADVYIMSSDDPNSGDEVLFAGRTLSTGTNSGTPSGSFISAQTGLDCTSCDTTNGNNVAEIATLTVTGGGAASGIYYENDGGTFTTTPYTGTFMLEQATQRGQVTASSLPTPPVAYFTNTGSEDDIVAFLVGTDDFASSGFVLFQTKSTPSFTASNVSGNYAEGTAEDISGLNGSETGVWNFNGVSAYTNVLDLVQTGGISTTPFMFNGSYALTNTGDGSGTYTSTGGTTVAFVTSGVAILSIEESSIQPQLHVFIQQPSN